MRYCDVGDSGTESFFLLYLGVVNPKLCSIYCCKVVLLWYILFFKMVYFAGSVVISFGVCSRLYKVVEWSVLLTLYREFIKGFIENNSNFTNILDD